MGWQKNDSLFAPYFPFRQPTNIHPARVSGLAGSRICPIAVAFGCPGVLREPWRFALTHLPSPHPSDVAKLGIAAYTPGLCIAP